MTEGLIMEWKKHEGDAITRGETLFSVENDKATIDVAAQADGKLARIIVQEMVTVPVGTVVGLIAAEGEKLGDSPGVPRVQSDAKAGAESPAVQKVPAVPAQVKAVPAAAQKSRAEDGFVLASPYARQLTDAIGIHLSSLRGTGPEGAVLARDVPGSDALAEKPTVSFPEAEPAQVPVQEGSSVDISLTRIQRVAAERMTESWTTIPQFTLYDEADAENLLAMTEAYKKAGTPVSLTVILAKLLAVAAERHPLMNAAWLGEGKVRTFNRANVNIAIDTQEGLVVPVLRNCSSRGLVALGKDMRSLAEKAQAKGLSTADYEGGTITLSNLGMFGIARFRAIINPPQTAILAVGRISEKVLRTAEGFEAKKFLEYSVTADHRAVDGANAARFMATLKVLIENPVRVLD